MKLSVVIQVPAWGFVKRDTAGSVDFISPLPCPFNYGEVPGTVAADGDSLDAVVLGARLSRGALVEAVVVGAIDFWDAGQADPKLICGAKPLTTTQRALVMRWFSGYALAKRLLNWRRNKTGLTTARGWLDAAQAAELVRRVDAREPVNND